MNAFKLTVICAVVAQIIATPALAADHDASADGAFAADADFAGQDVVLANIKDTFRPNTTVDFADNSELRATVENAITAGRQNFKDTAGVVVSAKDAINGGRLTFSDASFIRVTAANAIAGALLTFNDKSYFELDGADLNSKIIAVDLKDAGTAFILAGRSATVGGLVGKGTVRNGGADDSTLTVDTGAFGSGTFDGVLEDGGTGSLSLIKAGLGEWIFNGDGSGMTGTTTVNGGQLTVNGDLSKSAVTVNSSGVLSGKGTVGSVDVKRGGAVGAEFSSDTLTIDGKLQMTLGSTFYVSAGPDGKAGLVDVRDTASVNFASVQVAAGIGAYEPNTRYTILTAANGITGTFNGVKTNLYFLDPRLIYNDKSVELELHRNDKSIVSAAGTASAVNAAQTIGVATPGLINHLLVSDIKTAGLALEQLAGAANASRVSAMLASTGQVSGGMLQAMQQMESRGNSLQAAMLRDDGPLLVATGTPSDARGLQDPQAQGRVWLQALGSQGTFEQDDNPSDLKQRTNGALVGADWAVSPEWRLGVVSGYSKTDLDAGAFLTGAVNSYHVGAYALHQNGALATRMGLAYSGHSGTSKRELSFNEFTDTPRADYSAKGQQAFVEFGYQTASGRLLKEPFINLGYQRYNREAYDEKGGAAALHVDEQQQNNLSATLGLRLAHLGMLDNGMSVTPRASVGWRRMFGDVEVTTQQSYRSGGSTFDVYGSALDRNSMMLEAGVDLGVSAMQNLGIGYIGEMGSNARNHGLQAEWRLSF